jgi:excisionase family DNA binding protein
MILENSIVLDSLQAFTALDPNTKQEFLCDMQASEESGFEPLLNAHEAAQLLRMHEKTLQALARAGSVPCVRMGKYWRFRASSLDDWLTMQLESTHQSRRVN